MKVIVSQEIERVCPEFVGACVEAQVVNTAYCKELWQEIEALGNKYRAELTTESLKEMTSIAATRRVYKACGKDPSRYRPASEALIRRVLQGKELYQRDTLVDLVNLASIAFGYSIGGFDADKFVGDTLTLGVGREGEPYEGIGRGMINIHGLPVYRDAAGVRSIFTRSDIKQFECPCPVKGFPAAYWELDNCCFIFPLSSKRYDDSRCCNNFSHVLTSVS